MRPARSTLVIGAMGVIIAVLAWAVVYLARDELELTPQAQEEEIATASAILKIQ